MQQTYVVYEDKAIMKLMVVLVVALKSKSIGRQRPLLGVHWTSYSSCLIVCTGICANY